MTQSSSATEIPGLKRGLNLGQIFGNLGWYQSVGRNPFEAVRLRTLVNGADLDKIKLDGFDHVRIPIEPSAIGCDPAMGYAINPSKVVNDIDQINVPYSQPNAPCYAWQNLSALQRVVSAANIRGLKVILDCHPNPWNALDYAGHITPNLGETHYPVYPGTYAEPLVTGTPSKSHPLVNFWTSFALYFAEYNSGDVIFEVMNEPLIWVPKEYTSTSSGTYDSYKVWYKNAITQWHEIQTYAVDGIRQVCKDPTIIVTPATSLPHMLGNTQGLRISIGDYFNYPVNFLAENQYSAFSMSDFGDTSNLIVNIHPYESYIISHKASGQYEVPRDWYGVNVALHPNLGTTTEQEDNNVNDVRQRYYGMKKSLEFIQTFKLANPTVPMIATEFGPMRYNGLGNGYCTDRCFGGGAESVYDEHLTREQYLFDMRWAMENKLKIAWTVYDKSNGWGIYPGEPWTQINAFKRIHGHANMGNLSVNKTKALIGNVRPTP